MNYRVRYILLSFCLVILLVSCKQQHQSASNQFSDRFVADSGYILKQEGVTFLLKVKGNDTIDVNNSSLKNTDTIGKYYKTKTGNYIACILDIIHPNQNSHPVLFEYTPNGKVLKYENFYSGNYLCCWDNRYEGFKKHGNYYSIKTCVTGSGYCQGLLNIFKEIEPQSPFGITENVWSSICVFQPDEAPALACSLTSTMSIKSDTVSMHYKLEHIAFEGKDDEIRKVKDTEFFDIKYIKKEMGWIAVDSMHISKIPG
jgi:hypothetical protein